MKLHLKLQHFFLPASLSCALILSACGGGSSDKPKKVNRAPTGVASTFTTQADTELKGSLIGVDADSDTLTFTAMQAMEGTVVVTANGGFIYTPKADSIGTDQFTYTVSDGKLTSAATTVMITINPLDVAFGSYSRQAFAQESTATPLSLNTRNVQQDVTDPAAYDDLLQ